MSLGLSAPSDAGPQSVARKNYLRAKMRLALSKERLLHGLLPLLARIFSFHTPHLYAWRTPSSGESFKKYLYLSRG